MIKIMVDSASDSPKGDGVVDYYVPLTVSMCGRDFKPGIDLDSDTFYKMLVESKEFPKTSQPSPEDFAEIFRQVKEAGDELICFTLSSGLSGTYQSAVIAKQLVEYDGIYVVDTLSASHMIHHIARYAAKLRDEGKTADEIVAACEDVKGRIRVYLGVDTLEYLFRGGRLSRTSAAVATLASIKPILSLAGGKIETVGKTLGRGKALQFLAKQLEGVERDENFPAYSLYTMGEENCMELEKLLAESGCPVAGRLQVGPTIGAHVGPGVFAYYFVAKN